MQIAKLWRSLTLSLTAIVALNRRVRIGVVVNLTLNEFAARVQPPGVSDYTVIWVHTHKLGDKETGILVVDQHQLHLLERLVCVCNLCMCVRVCM